MISQRENVNFKWINHIKSIFDNVGLSYVWNQQNPIHLVELKLTVKQKLTDQFIQKWYNLIIFCIIFLLLHLYMCLSE
jgi:hypothetical protein